MQMSLSCNVRFWSISVLSHELGLVQVFTFIRSVSAPNFTHPYSVCFRFHRVSFVIVKAEFFMVQCIRAFFLFSFSWQCVILKLFVAGCKVFFH